MLYKSHYLWVAPLNIYFQCSCRQQDDTTEQELPQCPGRVCVVLFVLVVDRSGSLLLFLLPLQMQ